MTIVVILLLIITYCTIKYIYNKKRYKKLLLKYKNEELVKNLYKGTIKIGYTVEMLIDAWGKPCTINEDIKKTKIKYIYKYNNCGKNRYKDWVYIENGIIVGWKN